MNETSFDQVIGHLMRESRPPRCLGCRQTRVPRPSRRTRRSRSVVSWRSVASTKTKLDGGSLLQPRLILCAALRAGWPLTRWCRAVIPSVATEAKWRDPGDNRIRSAAASSLEGMSPGPATGASSTSRPTDVRHIPYVIHRRSNACRLRADWCGYRVLATRAPHRVFAPASRRLAPGLREGVFHVLVL